MTVLESRERYLQRVLDSQFREHAKTSGTDTEQNAEEDQSRQSRTSPNQHYHIAESSRQSQDITGWLCSLVEDPATENFLPRLKDHLLGRILGRKLEDEFHEFSDEDRDGLVIVNNLMYEHSVLRVNYTTYDLRREQDSINPRTRPDIMMLSHETDELRHPYWYARVIRIFHVNVRHFGADSTSGFTARRLHRIGFVEAGDPDAFGFVDPDVVLRGVHLIPSFAHGHTSEYLGPSFVRPATDDDKDVLGLLIVTCSCVFEGEESVTLYPVTGMTSCRWTGPISKLAGTRRLTQKTQMIWEGMSMLQTWISMKTMG